MADLRSFRNLESILNAFEFSVKGDLHTAGSLSL
jgi:hypothetical protein